MEINEYLLKLFRTIKDMEELNLFPEAAKLTKTEFRLIREIVLEEERGKCIISSELARRLGITRSAISQIVSKLEARDIVRRIDSPTDKKIAYIRLSDRAISIFEEQCKQANEIIGRVVEKMGEKKLHALIDGYDAFAAALTEARKTYSTHKE